MGADVATSLTIQRPATILSKIGASDLRRFPRRSIRQQKITFAEMRAQGAPSLLPTTTAPTRWRSTRIDGPMMSGSPISRRASSVAARNDFARAMPPRRLEVRPLRQPSLEVPGLSSPNRTPSGATLHVSWTRMWSPPRFRCEWPTTSRCRTRPPTGLRYWSRSRKLEPISAFFLIGS